MLASRKHRPGRRGGSLARWPDPSDNAKCGGISPKHLPASVDSLVYTHPKRTRNALSSGSQHGPPGALTPAASVVLDHEKESSRARLLAITEGPGFDFGDASSAFDHPAADSSAPRDAAADCEESRENAHLRHRPGCADAQRRAMLEFFASLMLREWSAVRPGDGGAPTKHTQVCARPGCDLPLATDLYVEALMARADDEDSAAGNVGGGREASKVGGSRAREKRKRVAMLLGRHAGIPSVRVPSKEAGGGTARLHTWCLPQRMMMQALVPMRVNGDVVICALGHRTAPMVVAPPHDDHDDDPGVGEDDGGGGGGIGSRTAADARSAAGRTVHEVVPGELGGRIPPLRSAAVAAGSPRGAADGSATSPGMSPRRERGAVRTRKIHVADLDLGLSPRRDRGDTDRAPPFGGGITVALPAVQSASRHSTASAAAGSASRRTSQATEPTRDPGGARRGGGSRAVSPVPLMASRTGLAGGGGGGGGGAAPATPVTPGTPGTPGTLSSMGAAAERLIMRDPTKAAGGADGAGRAGAMRARGTAPSGGLSFMAEPPPTRGAISISKARMAARGIKGSSPVTGVGRIGDSGERADDPRAALRVPVGFRSERMYRSTRLRGRKCLYVSTVTQESIHHRVEFTVTAEAPDSFRATGRTATEAWSQVYLAVAALDKRVHAPEKWQQPLQSRWGSFECGILQERGVPGPPAPPARTAPLASVGISGERCFGFDDPAVQLALSAFLPRVEDLVATDEAVRYRSQVSIAVLRIQRFVRTHLIKPIPMDIIPEGVAANDAVPTVARLLRRTLLRKVTHLRRNLAVAITERLLRRSAVEVATFLNSGALLQEAVRGVVADLIEDSREQGSTEPESVRRAEIRRQVLDLVGRFHPDQAPTITRILMQRAEGELLQLLENLPKFHRTASLVAIGLRDASRWEEDEDSTEVQSRVSGGSGSERASVAVVVHPGAG